MVPPHLKQRVWSPQDFEVFEQKLTKGAADRNGYVQRGCTFPSLRGLAFSVCESKTDGRPNLHDLRAVSRVTVKVLWFSCVHARVLGKIDLEQPGP